MPMSTEPNAPPAVQQRPTQGVSPGQRGREQDQRGSQRGTPAAGRMGEQPFGEGYRQQSPATPPAVPVLFDDLDGVLLFRLYPDAIGGEDARDKAKQAAQQAYVLSTRIIAAQQEPARGPDGEPQSQPQADYQTGTGAPPSDPGHPEVGREQMEPLRPDEQGLQGGQTAAGEAFPVQQHDDEQSRERERSLGREDEGRRNDEQRRD